jgi:hypothetical protein
MDSFFLYKKNYSVKASKILWRVLIQCLQILKRKAKESNDSVYIGIGGRDPHIPNLDATADVGE